MLTPLLSIVIPLKDEALNLPTLLAEISDQMGTLDIPWELLAIDDGSTDQSVEVLKHLAQTYPQLRIFSMDVNRGQSAALHAGFQRAIGKWILTLDADLQNDPRDIPKLLAHKDHYALVCGYRARRRDSLSKRWISKCANAVRQGFGLDRVRDTGCSLKLLRASTAKALWMFRGAHRFLPALIALHGGKTFEIAVHHRPRTAGKSKYHLFNRGLAPIIDLLGTAWLARRRLKYQITEVERVPDESL